MSCTMTGMSSGDTGHLRILVGGNINEARRKKGITQRDLADAVGATPTQVSNWVTGKQLPLSYLSKLADVLTNGDISAFYKGHIDD